MLPPAPAHIGRVGAVATADPVVSKQQYVARLSDGLIGYFRDAVGIGQTARPQTGQDLLKPVRLKANQVNVETAEFEIAQLTAEQIEVPTSPRRKLIVGQAKSSCFSSSLQPRATNTGMDFSLSRAAAATLP